jgi:hypothetical protein
MLELSRERARLHQTVERQANEIAELRRRIEEGQARSPKATTIDPARQKANALKALAGGKRGKSQADIHMAVRDLVRLGDAVVPDVVALLKSGVTHSYGGGFGIHGSTVSTYADSRMAMIDVLRQIGTPAAGQGLLEAVGASDALSDYRDLFLLCSTTEDRQMTRGITALIPRAFRLLARQEGDDRTGRMLEIRLAAWIQEHAVSAVLSDLAERVEKRASDYRGPDFLAWALVALSPDRAAEVACRIAVKKDGMAAVQRFAFLATRSFQRIPLAKVAQFYERLFSGVNLSPEVRMKIFARMPTRPPREIEGIAARAADARALHAFLVSQLAQEADPETRKILESHIERLRKEIERATPR